MHHNASQSCYRDEVQVFRNQGLWLLEEAGGVISKNNNIFFYKIVIIMRWKLIMIFCKDKVGSQP